MDNRATTGGVPDALCPEPIVDARRRLAAGGWQERAPGAVLRVQKIMGAIFAIFAVVGAPFWVSFLLLLTMSQNGESASLTVVGLALAFVAAMVVVPQVVARTLHRQWIATRAALVELVDPYDQAIRDPRWEAAKTLLLELCGSDLEAPETESVRQLTRALADEFIALERVRGPAEAAMSIGGDGTEALTALYAEQDAAIERSLVDLKRICADALRGAVTRERAADDLLADLRARTGAVQETERVTARRTAPRRRALEP